MLPEHLWNKENKWWQRLILKLHYQFHQFRILHYQALKLTRPLEYYDLSISYTMYLLGTGRREANRFCIFHLPLYCMTTGWAFYTLLQLWLCMPRRHLPAQRVLSSRTSRTSRLYIVTKSCFVCVMRTWVCCSELSQPRRFYVQILTGLGVIWFDNRHRQ